MFVADEVLLGRSAGAEAVPLRGGDFIRHINEHPCVGHLFAQDSIKIGVGGDEDTGADVSRGVHLGGQHAADKARAPGRAQRFIERHQRNAHHGHQWKN